MSELKTCPFCKGEARPMAQHWDDGSHVWWVECRACGAEGKRCDDIFEAIDAWNSRAPIEYDGWFYLPKPKKKLGCFTDRISLDDDGTTVKATSYGDFHAFADAVIEWQNESLNEQIVQRICEAWNARPERTCRVEERNGDWYCSNCGEMVGTCDTASELFIDGNAVELWNYCPNCGARVEVEE